MIRRSFPLLAGLALLTMVPVYAVAQKVVTRRPLVLSNPIATGSAAKLDFQTPNKVSAGGQAAIKQQRIISLPTFSSSFTFQGQVFPFTMVGNDPTLGGQQKVNTSLVALSFFFDEFVDQNNNNIVIDVAGNLPKFVNSPLFNPASFPNGSLQFGDADLRAEFQSVMKDNWHTEFNAPRLLTPVQIEVPPGAALVFQNPVTGGFAALLDANFFLSQLNTIVQLENLDPTELLTFLSQDVFLFVGNPGNCCIGGFHSEFELGQTANKFQIQTFAWASWISPGELADPTALDIFGISHEMAETLNDPFGSNPTPPWQFPDGSGACQANLEVGDPVEVLNNAGFPVSLNGFTYHPTSLAMLQWFSREVPSDAFGQAYSFPNPALLPGPSQACGAGAASTAGH